MSTLRCRALLFDLDGVLVDSTASIERAWHAWAAHHGLDVNHVLRTAHGRRTLETLSLVAPHLDAAAEVASLAAVELSDLDAVEPIAGAGDLLAALPAGRWAVVTSGSRAIATGRLAAVGLPTPAVLVTAEDVEQGKPDPEGFLTAAVRLGLDPSACVVIEDTSPGVAAATAAGMRSIAVVGTHTAAQLAGATFVVPMLAEIYVGTDGENGDLVVAVRESAGQPA